MNLLVYVILRLEMTAVKRLNNIVLGNNIITYLTCHAYFNLPYFLSFAKDLQFPPSVPPVFFPAV